MEITCHHCKSNFWVKYSVAKVACPSCDAVIEAPAKAGGNETEPALLCKKCEAASQVATVWRPKSQFKISAAHVGLLRCEKCSTLMRPPEQTWVYRLALFLGGTWGLLGLVFAFITVREHGGSRELLPALLLLPLGFFLAAWTNSWLRLPVAIRKKAE